MKRSFDDDKAWEQFWNTSINPLGKVVVWTRAAHWYRDGTFFSPSFKWWHPFTWVYVLLFFVMIIPACMLTDNTVDELLKLLWEDLTVREHFKENPDRLRWYN